MPSDCTRRNILNPPTGTADVRAVTKLVQRRQVGRWSMVAVLAVVAVTAACAPPPEVVPEVRSARVVVPSIPLPPVPSMQVDSTTIDAARCDGCDDAGRFFVGQLGTAAIDALTRSPQPSLEQQRQQLGSLLVAGYFGGLRVRDLMGGELAAADLSPFGPALDAIGGSTIVELDRIVGQLLAASRGTDPLALAATSVAVAPVLANLGGFVRSYVDVLLAHPPAGYDPATAPLTCTGLFDCRHVGLPLGALDRLASAKAAVTAELHDIGTAAGASAEAAFDGVVDAVALSSEAYATLLDLAGGVLQAIEAALWGAAAGRLGLVEPAQAALAATAGVLVWAGSWALGLASSLPADARPALL